MQALKIIKYIIVFLLVICVGLFGGYIYSVLSTKPYDVYGELFLETKPIPFVKGNKYGYLDSSGKEIIRPAYVSAQEFFNGFAVVTIPNDAELNSAYIYQVIDERGNVIISSISNNAINQIKDYNVWLIDGKLYDSSLRQITEDGYLLTYDKLGYFSFRTKDHDEFGIMNHKGEIIYETKDEILSFTVSQNEHEENNHYAVLKTKNKEEIINLKENKTILKNEDTSKFFYRVYDDNIFALTDAETLVNYKYMFIDNNEVIKEYEDVVEIKVEDYSKKLLYIDHGYYYQDKNLENRYQYYNWETKEVLSNYTGIFDDERVYGYHIFRCTDVYGIAKRDNVLIGCSHSEIKFLNETVYKYLQKKNNMDLILLKNADNTVLYDLINKKDIYKFTTLDVYADSESIFIYGKESERMVVYNLVSKQEKVFSKDAVINLFAHYFTVTENNITTYYNSEFNKIYAFNNAIQ